jgi:hypothetical protein
MPNTSHPLTRLNDDLLTRGDTVTRSGPAPTDGRKR